MDKIYIKYADQAMPFTGERFTSLLAHSQIEAEHVHRYLLARKFCENKSVLDIACGEGYGSWILSKVANSVLGVDVDAATIKHADTFYKQNNLHFMIGDARKIPCQDHSIDVVVSFETIEHICEHNIFISELKRVLKSNGTLIISSPDCNVYSSDDKTNNPYHLKELSKDEFLEFLSNNFLNVAQFSQQALIGSLIVPDNNTSSNLIVFERKSIDIVEEHNHLASSPYSLIIASDSDSIPVFTSAFIEISEYGFIMSEHKTLMSNAKRQAENADFEPSNLLNQFSEVRQKIHDIYTQPDKSDRQIISDLSNLFLESEKIYQARVREIQNSIDAIKRTSNDRAGAILHLEGVIKTMKEGNDLP
ncbi:MULTISPECIES: class I SAM-dependent methyltransferase [Methylobacterium]|uniref:SAM-dependent methyltransferases n=2 Tax=Methylobacterium TaxID=407 RepID=A0A0C6G0C1_9HYPH|nr:class I SAM-dependent methyltransferase [Methylobacterium aquaticum]BAQ49160.1 SAM-dependent methyltransferases [Methylobacterium aquaticum]